jgi:catechol 2,3-dioxygenase-like lactoylglutathione lyase family enzyme
MKRSPMTAALVCFLFASGGDTAKRPRILGIASVTIFVNDPEAATSFYSKQLQYPHDRHTACDAAPHTCLAVGNGQRLDIVSPSSPTEGHYLGEIAFETDHIYALRDKLNSSGIKASEIVKSAGDRSHYYVLSFSVVDPENHPVKFVEYEGCIVCEGDPDNPVSSHLIHAGFVVHDRAAEDKFYKDILGFHVYWHGGMKEGEDNWVDVQVPDGTDWIEYMLKVPDNATHKQLGVMNHIALGVPDIHAAQQQLIKNGWKGTEEPKIGRDGKWQLNLYDPDETRVELMEFKPTKEPCCSPYTGPHPGPSQ